MYARPCVYSTVVSVCPMSEIVLNSGCCFGSQMIASGLISSGVMTVMTGCLSEYCTVSSVATKPMWIDLSVYMTAGTGWKPTAGPPLRTSIFTPVSTPSATSGPVTFLALVSIL
jgi:hypothetical protein